MNMKSKKIVLFLTALVLILGGACFPETSTSIFNVSTNVYAESTYEDLVYEISNGEVTITKCDKSATKVEIPSEIEGYPVTSIADSAFKDCTRLTSVTIPNSVTSIGEMAFNSCYSLNSITVDENNLNYSDIDGVLFNKNKTKLIHYALAKTNTSYVIPDSVTSIGEYAFAGCNTLTSITIPDSVTSVSKCAFYYCKNLISITFPNSVTSIGESAFV